MSSCYISIKNFVWRLALKYLVNPKKIVKVHGMIMHLDNKDSLLLSLRTNYEPKHVSFMKSVVKEGDIVVDIGANIGYYTLLLAKLVGPNGKVFAFEPDPYNFRVLKQNVHENNLNNVVLEQKALSNKNGKTTLFISKINSGDSRVYFTSEGNERVEVESVRLNDYFNKIKPKIAFIKVDVQGFEPAVFEGMQDILNEQKIVLTAEFWPRGLESANYNPIDFLNFLKKKGFNLYDLDKSEKIIHFDIFLKSLKERDYFTTIVCSRKTIS